MRYCWLLAVLLLGACGDEAGTEAQGEVAVAEAGEGSAAASSELVPAYPGAVAVEVPNLGVVGTDSRSGNATASETSDSPMEVAAFYREHFTAADVPVRVDTAGENGGLMGIGRDGEQGAMLTIGRSGEKTRISVIQKR